jgi:hypothetical protein
MSNDTVSSGRKRTRGDSFERCPVVGSLGVTLAKVPAYLQKGELSLEP